MPQSQPRGIGRPLITGCEKDLLAGFLARIGPEAAIGLIFGMWNEIHNTAEALPRQEELLRAVLNEAHLHLRR